MIFTEKIAQGENLQQSLLYLQKQSLYIGILSLAIQFHKRVLLKGKPFAFP